MNAAQLFCIILCALLCAHGLAANKSKKKQPVTYEPNPPPTNHSARLIGECLQKKFTQSSCLKVFCLPWERCVDGKCLCKLPYQCPKNGTVQACSASKRTFRTYCQQKSYECLNAKEYFATLSADCSKAGTFSVKLKSEDGMVAKSNGTVEVLLPLAKKAKFICQKYWTTQEANVVCRQLGFNKQEDGQVNLPPDTNFGADVYVVPRGAAVPVVVTQNLTMPVSDLGCLQVTCRGPETSLTECIITDGLRMHNMEKAAEVQCVEESRACTKKQFQCVNEKCIPLSKVCDGINDCGDLSDELCCSECSKKGFHCHSDICIPLWFRCNGEIDCIHGDDEKGCVDSPQKSAQEQKQTVVVNMDEERKLIKSSLPQLTCGIEYHRNTRQKRIVGGEKAHKDQFPWQVAIKDGESVNCGGIYIGGCWVLTAAHCVSASRPQQYRIMVGLLNRMEYDSDIDSFPVIQVNVHEDYNPSTYQNDIALLKVQNIYNEEKCMAADNTVMPACLPWSEYLFKAGDVCKVSGWGREEGFHKVFFLKWGHISLMSNCSAIYKERFYENMECAGTHDGSIDSCKGDSGGPLVCVDSNNVAYLWGIVSWGENCGLPGYPGVYTKVANYFEWISRLVGRQSISRYNV